MYMLNELVCVECNTMKWHGRPVNTPAKEGYGVSWEDCEYRSRGEEYGVISERPKGTTVEERSMVLFRRDLWVPPQTGGVGVSPGEVCVNC